MGHCQKCGKEVIGEGLCPNCYSDETWNRDFDRGFKRWMAFWWRWLFKPLLPTAIVLTAFQWLGVAVLAATGSQLLMAIPMYVGYGVATVVFGILFKKNVGKRLKGGYWVKVMPYFAGILIFTAVASGGVAITNQSPDLASTLIVDALLLALAVGQIVWMIHTYRVAASAPPEAM